MSHSSLLGDDDVPMVPPGHSTGDLGPSDLSDTGSDMVGTGMTDSDSDSSGTGERSRSGAVPPDSALAPWQGAQ